MDASILYGRQIVLGEKDLEGLNNLQVKPALVVGKRGVICQRCGQTTSLKLARLPTGKYYCPNCLLLGRLTSADRLYNLPEPHLFEYQKNSLTWQGQLSKYQEKCSAQLQTVVKHGGKHLLWAVTGAGKTEMLFETINWALQTGKRVGLASPRVDVCNELFPRLQAAFAKTPMILLHGHAKESYRYTQLVVATTHQLLRFYQAFDLLIIDEVDAFPFVDDPGLHYAANNALIPGGTLVYLTATPSRKLLAAVKKKELSVSYLPLRFHGYLLPTINLVAVAKLRSQLDEGILNSKIKKILLRWQEEGYQFLVFVPRIALLKPVYQAIANLLKPELKGQTVYANDGQRIEKVAKMRAQEYRYLVTTTILERGVTFPGINIMVLAADDSNFSTAALVQIAGRVGRNKARPTGDVYFFCQDYTRTVKAACKQIKFLNRKGKKLKKDE